MWIALIGGITIGLGTDWLGRLVLPILAGIIACFELFFSRLRGPLRSRHVRKMKNAGMTEIELKELKETFRDVNDPTLNLGMSKGRLYGTLFTWTYVMTLIISIITGLIKQIFF